MRLDRILTAIRRVIGAPDYERYLEHVRRAHPERIPMSREEFMRARLEDRYARPEARCC